MKERREARWQAIVASLLAESAVRPTALCSFDGDGFARNKWLLGNVTNHAHEEKKCKKTRACRNRRSRG